MGPRPNKAVRLHRHHASQHSSPGTPSGRRADDLELQAINRAVQDEDAENRVDGGRSGFRIQPRGTSLDLEAGGGGGGGIIPPRRSSLLDRLVQEDRGVESSPGRKDAKAEPEKRGALARAVSELGPLAETEESADSSHIQQDKSSAVVPDMARDRSHTACHAPALRENRSPRQTNRTGDVSSRGDGGNVSDAGESYDDPNPGSQGRSTFLAAMKRRGRSFGASSQLSSTTDSHAAAPNQRSEKPVPEGSNRIDDNEEPDSQDHEDGVLDYLDVVDPEVGVLNHMSNIQSSIFLPNLSALYDNRISHHLPKRTSSRRRAPDDLSYRDRSRPASGVGSAFTATQGHLSAEQSVRPSMISRLSSAMTLGRMKPAMPPEHIDAWTSMNEDQKHELDAHVDHLLSRPERFRRGFRGFLKWARTPVGFIMLCYGLAITGWGIAICLFILHWTTVKDPHERRLWIEYCDQVLCALFAAVGLGFAPFRVVDTWRMIHIAKYHHLSWRRRRNLELPDLPDPNDLPKPRGYNEVYPKPDQRALELIQEEPALTSDDHLSRHRSGSSVSRPSPNESQSDRSSVNSAQELAARHRSLDNESTAPALPQALSNVKAMTGKRQRHPWGLFGSRREQQSAKQAADTAMEAVRRASPDPAFKIQQERIAAGCGEVSALPTTTHGDHPNPKSNSTYQRPPSLARNLSLASEIIKEKEDVVVLTPQEQEVLTHHQRAFAKSHHYYRFHETATHRAFPLDLMIVIVCLLDCHSILQGTLGGVTWGIRYEHRPTALTASLITCSLSCNAVAGIIIWLGGRRTKKAKEVKRRLRIAMEEMAYERIQKGKSLPAPTRKRASISQT